LAASNAGFERGGRHEVCAIVCPRERTPRQNNPQRGGATANFRRFGSSLAERAELWCSRERAAIGEAMDNKPRKLTKGATGDFEVVIGMEVHAQITSKTKLFSGASTEFGKEPNSNVSLIDAAMPGMLPVINEECVAQAVRTGLGLKAKINPRSVFDRKNYFYPDLPQGYQISQYKNPIGGEGSVTVDISPTEQVEVGIERLHIEQDAGKSLHDQSATDSFVDLNRSGVGLMEIVSKPDLRSPEEAKAYVAKLRTILRYLGTCDGNMEQGSLRADVNVSVRRPGEPLGTRCEIKNVNSIRFIGQAVEAEARRQIGIIDDGGKIDQETRLFDPWRGETRSMRSKEEAHDYRYFPDPDLLPLEFDQAYVDALAGYLPELPDTKKARFIREYRLPPYDAGVLVADKDTADYFEAAAAYGGTPRDAKLVANWIIGDVAAFANSQALSVPQTHIMPWQIATIVDLIAEARGMKQVTDQALIEACVDAIIAINPDKVAQARVKPSMLGWFVGQVMKETDGKASPRTVNDILKAKLGI
jgi:aspartyl-tRNA(Asn)/glutamyl-tRNA(Gln) amidotransferase subunit B